MRLRVVTVIIRPLSVTVQKQPFYNLFEKIAFPILCLTDEQLQLLISTMLCQRHERCPMFFNAVFLYVCVFFNAVFVFVSSLMLSLYECVFFNAMFVRTCLL